MSDADISALERAAKATGDPWDRYRLRYERWRRGEDVGIEVGDFVWTRNPGGEGVVVNFWSREKGWRDCDWKDCDFVTIQMGDYKGIWTARGHDYGLLRPVLP